MNGEGPLPALRRLRGPARNRAPRSGPRRVARPEAVRLCGIRPMIETRRRGSAAAVISARGRQLLTSGSLDVDRTATNTSPAVPPSTGGARTARATRGVWRHGRHDKRDPVDAGVSASEGQGLVPSGLQTGRREPRLEGRFLRPSVAGLAIGAGILWSRRATLLNDLQLQRPLRPPDLGSHRATMRVATASEVGAPMRRACFSSTR